MKIELVRHFKVDHKWKKYKTSEEVIEACENYNNAGIINTFNIRNKYKKIYISSFIRTKLTSEYLENKEIIIMDPLLNELTMNPFIKTKMKLPIMIWIIVWKLCWNLNIPVATETRTQTESRVKKFINKVEKEGENITIVGHALLFIVMLKELKKRNYKGKYRQKFFENGEIREFIKEQSNCRR